MLTLKVNQWLPHICISMYMYIQALRRKKNKEKNNITDCRKRKREKREWNWTETFVLKLKWPQFRYNKALERKRSAGEKTWFFSSCLSSIFFSSSYFCLQHRLVLTAFERRPRHIHAHTHTQRRQGRWFPWVAERNMNFRRMHENTYQCSQQFGSKFIIKYAATFE